jgi:hypothetical protein
MSTGGKVNNLEWPNKTYDTTALFMYPAHLGQWNNNHFYLDGSVGLHICK